MANSIKARFNDNCKIEVAMSDDTTVTKAVIIDADGAETEIGGGGSSDFSTAEVTITANAGEGVVTLISTLAFSEPGYIFIDTHEDDQGKIGYSSKNVEGGSSITATALLIDGEASFVVFSDGNVVVTGNAEYIADDQWLTIHGDCTISADPTRQD